MNALEKCLLEYDLSQGKYLSLKSVGNDSTVVLKNSFLLKVPFLGRLYRKWVVSQKFAAVVEWLLINKSDLIFSNKDISQKLKNSIQNYYKNSRHQKDWGRIKDLFIKVWPAKTTLPAHTAKPAEASVHIESAEPEQDKEPHQEWVDRFQKEHCIITEQFKKVSDNGMKISEGLAAELKKLLKQHPTLKFYFTTLIGHNVHLDMNHFKEAVRQLNDDDICVIVPVSTFYACPEAMNKQVDGKQFFMWYTFFPNDRKTTLSIDPDPRPGSVMNAVFKQRAENLGLLKTHLANPENIKIYKKSVVDMRV